MITVNDGKIGELSAKIYDAITGIQSGKLEDKMNWTTKI
jgi:branched-chain amino acid aminotransferase